MQVSYGRPRLADRELPPQVALGNTIVELDDAHISVPALKLLLEDRFNIPASMQHLQLSSGVDLVETDFANAEADIILTEALSINVEYSEYGKVVDTFAIALQGSTRVTELKYVLSTKRGISADRITLRNKTGITQRDDDVITKDQILCMADSHKFNLRVKWVQKEGARCCAPCDCRLAHDIPRGCTQLSSTHGMRNGLV